MHVLWLIDWRMEYLISLARGNYTSYAINLLSFISAS